MDAPRYNALNTSPSSTVQDAVGLSDALKRGERWHEAAAAAIAQVVAEADPPDTDSKASLLVFLQEVCALRVLRVWIPAALFMVEGDRRVCFRKM